MTRKTTILVAVHALTGGTTAKDEEKFKVRAGSELTDDVIKRLGLDAKTIEKLKETGAIVAQSAIAAEPGEDVATLEAQLSTERKRADDAEAKVRDLEAQLAAAKKTGA
ncbi:hypothetical protein N5J77_02040 [Sphingobium yanoikuyae]|uniref:Uncharacterized protein n=1 Tax=Sphingobium yanoikuyae TaxID=13690 RepID=A0AA42WU43_SPHYA|nr:hypothetical protein [Sphingobium yanoikuyae]MDH2129889.1 hypothetical protein [Sphingobium yanoikuyae]MDH2147883.1 hypothetical protein [Sphingobium yanoikuyae]MDH2165152.1 hypothetical protein [Sphingobium yanoikuyae]